VVKDQPGFLDGSSAISTSRGVLVRSANTWCWWHSLLSFPTVLSWRFLWKLSNQGTRVLIHTSNWLNDRKLQVEVNGRFPQWREVTEGVVQVSCLC